LAEDGTVMIEVVEAKINEKVLYTNAENFIELEEKLYTVFWKTKEEVEDFIKNHTR
jgi:hypothetical protein